MASFFCLLKREWKNDIGFSLNFWDDELLYTDLFELVYTSCYNHNILIIVLISFLQISVFVLFNHHIPFPMLRGIYCICHYAPTIVKFVWLVCFSYVTFLHYQLQRLNSQLFLIYFDPHFNLFSQQIYYLSWQLWVQSLGLAVLKNHTCTERYNLSKSKQKKSQEVILWSPARETDTTLWS